MCSAVRVEERIELAYRCTSIWSDKNSVHSEGLRSDDVAHKIVNKYGLVWLWIVELLEG